MGAAAWLHAEPLTEAHQLARAGRFHHPLPELWAVVLDIGAYPEWRSDLAAVERQPDVRGHEVWREVPKSGAPVTWETVETLKERRLVRCVVDQDGPFGGCTTVEIIRRDDGAILTFAEKLKIHDLSFRLTNTMAGRRAAVDQWLTDLGARFDETPRLADLPKDLRDPPKPAAPPVPAPDGPAVDQPAAARAAPDDPAAGAADQPPVPDAPDSPTPAAETP